MSPTLGKENHDRIASARLLSASAHPNQRPATAAESVWAGLLRERGERWRRVNGRLLLAELAGMRAL